MSSVPSNVAAHATATSAPDHPVWFHRRDQEFCIFAVKSGVRRDQEFGIVAVKFGVRRAEEFLCAPAEALQHCASLTGA